MSCLSRGNGESVWSTPVLTRYDWMDEPSGVGRVVEGDLTFLCSSYSRSEVKDLWGRRGEVCAGGGGYGIGAGCM